MSFQQGTCPHDVSGVGRSPGLFLNITAVEEGGVRFCKSERVLRQAGRQRSLRPRRPFVAGGSV
jgi:hypothetical protein